MKRLRSANGVEYLLDHLQQELEPVEHLNTFTVIHEFFHGFKRLKGEEFVSYDTRFRGMLQKLEEIGAPLEGLVRSYWFLTCAGISADLRKQVVAASGGSYQYEKLRASLVAIVPTVKKEDTEAKNNAETQKTRFFRQKDSKAHGVHAVEDGGEEDGPPTEGDGGEDDEEAMAMEQEAQVLMTQAARKRATAEKARGFQKVESSRDREARLEKLKTTLPCAACRAHGRTSFGHWQADKECPFYEETQKMKQSKASGSQERKVFTVTEEQESDTSDSEEDAFAVMMTQACAAMEIDYAMTDTCCAKTVAGEEWAQQQMKKLWENGVEFGVVRESQPFCFGPGKRIHSTYALVFPLQSGLRIS